MSTSDPKAGAPEAAAVPAVDLLNLQPMAAGFEPTAVLGVLPGAPSQAGWPDPQLVANWANEFFRGAALTAADPVSRAPASGATAGSELGLPLGRVGAQLPLGPQTSAWHVPGLLAATPEHAAGAPTSLEPPQGLAGYGFLAESGLPTESGAAARSLYEPQPLAADEPALSPYAYAAPNDSTAASRGSDVRPPLSLYEYDAPGSRDVLGRRQFDVQTLRADFPILNEIVDGKPLVWLDNAATTQKPRAVIERIAHFYEHENSNIHRAAHSLAARSTDAYEAARESSRRFINAPSTENIVFVRGTTEAINLVAQSWGRRNLRAGDEIVITWLEHHSNIVPWQLLCAETGARLRVAPIDNDGQVLLDEYERLMGPRTRLVSFTQVSNALGSVQPAREMVEIAHRYGARVLVDGAQAVSHMRVDVQALDCDFYAFSGHKVFGPTGIGVLFGKGELLQSMPAWQGGGNMIVDVTFDKTVYAPAPGRFEAGTGNIADAVGLGAALEYVERIGIENIARYEHELLEYGTAKLLEIPRLRLIGTAREKAGVLGFVIDGIPTEQIGATLAKEGIAVRAGHHCAQPALRRYGLETTVRPSLALYNTREDLDALVSTLRQLQTSWLR